MVANLTTRDIREAFADYDRNDAIGRIRTGCWLAIVLLPLGCVVDRIAYYTAFWDYLIIRGVYAGLMFPLLWVVSTDWGQRNHRTLGVVLAMIPAACMSTIIYFTRDPASPYYAGLNLVLLTIGLVLRWDLTQSVVALFLVLAMYTGVLLTRLDKLIPHRNGQAAPQGSTVLGTVEDVNRGILNSTHALDRLAGEIPTNSPALPLVLDGRKQLERAGFQLGNIRNSLSVKGGGSPREFLTDSLYLGEVVFCNTYFILLTGIIVVVGNYVQSGLRLREFAAQEELKRNREQLALSNDELKQSQLKLELSNQELISREHELEESNKRLREMDEAKGRFFANISHELRTPLTLLLAPLESIRSSRDQFIDARQRELLDTMYANGMRLLKLINDLLDLVRLESNSIKLHLARIDVEPFLEGLLNSIKAVATEKAIRLTCDVDSELKWIRADSDKLEKIFLNLLFNAVKFTPAGGRISVLAQIEGDFVVFEVKDSGVGIAPEHLPHIFERFWQVDSSAQRKFQGAGIGLALVKELATAHGGNVEARSTPGMGTTMIIRLPRIEAAESNADQNGSTPGETPKASEKPDSVKSVGDTEWLSQLYRRAEMFPGIVPLREALRPTTGMSGSRRPKLLIADDEPDMRRFLRSQLSDEYELMEAVDGEQATSMAAQYLPDVMVCDMMMPEKDGLQVCQDLRKRSTTRSLPFLMLTARADDETKLMALRAGANDFLTKPFSITEIRLRLKNLVDSFHLQKQLAWQNQKLEATVEQLKETEVQLVQSEKLASLGRMSAGIIHEINNPLNYAKSAAQYLSRCLEDVPESRRADFADTLKDIEDGLVRVAGIVTDLRSFTHPHGSALGAVDVHGVIVSSLRFLAAEWRDKVDIINEVPAEFDVLADRNKLIQVFVNLIQNALDALTEKTFTDSTPQIRISAEERPGLKVVKIRDNGMGISQDNITKIFDPFFTTKEVGKGTGLGLSICFRIISDSGGRIAVRSEPGQWTEFSLEFPVHI
jgi:signal transduction histidine kinase